MLLGNYNQFEKEDTEVELGSDGDGEKHVGGLFRIVRKKQQHQQEERDLMNAVDCSRFAAKQVRDWTDSKVSSCLRGASSWSADC
jgi:hypothetical protein